MPKATTATVRRRKVICRATTVNAPTKSAKWDALMRLSTPELKNLLRAAKIGIPKEKHMMAERLSEHESVAVAVTTEAVVFGAPGKPVPC
jgi:hypothetical protein